MKRTTAHRIASGIIAVLILAGAWGIYRALAPGMNGASGPGTGAEGPRAGGRGAGGNSGQDGAGGAQGGGGNAGARATAVEVRELARGTVSTYILTNGDVLSTTEVEVYSEVAGKVVSYYVETGDTVAKGQTIARVDPSKPGETYSPSPAQASIGGTVTSAPVSVGDSVSTQTPLAVVSDLESIVIETYIPERFVTNMRAGLPASVSFEALPGESFEAVIDTLDPVIDASSRTLEARLSLTRRDPRIMVGMFARIRLVTEQRVDVPMIPRQSVITAYDTDYAFVVNENGTAERRELELGLRGEEMMEVLSGIEPGERVVIRGQSFLSDGDPVRIVEQR